jgi:hypothetical protein
MEFIKRMTREEPEDFIKSLAQWARCVLERIMRARQAQFIVDRR